MPAFTRESLRKRDFSRRRKCKEAGGCFSAKKNGAMTVRGKTAAFCVFEKRHSFYAVSSFL